MTIYKIILVPVDFSNVSLKVVQRGAELARYYQSQLVVLHILEDLPMAVSTFGETAGLVLPPDVNEEYFNNAREQLQALAKQAQVEESAQLEIVHGVPSAAIEEFAEQHDVDLIVIGHSTKSGLLGFIMGSTAATVVKHAKCDVFVINTPRPRTEETAAEV